MNDTSRRARRELSFHDRGVLALIAAAATFLCYTPALGFQWVWDDRFGILENPFVTSSIGLARYFEEPFWSHIQSIPPIYYRPVFLLWFRTNWILFGRSSLAFHLTTIVVHVAVTWLVFAIAEKLTRDRSVAFVAAMLFGLHPLHVESVAWVSGVADPLLALYYLGSLLALMRTFDAQSKRALWYAVSLALFCLALLQKEPAVTLPMVVLAFALLCTDGQPNTRVKRALITVLPYAVLTAGYFVVRMNVLHFAAFRIVLISVSTMLKTWPSLLTFYLRLLFWPAGLSPYYDVGYVEHATFESFWGPLLLLIAVVTIVLVWMRRDWERGRTVLFLLIAAIVSLGPAMYIRAFHLGDYAHDRYVYLSTAAIMIVIAIAIRSILTRAGEYMKDVSKGMFVAGCVLGAILLAITIHQSLFWSSDLVLYRRAVAIAPHNNVALGNFGTALVDRGQFQDAAVILRQAVKEDPTSFSNHMNLGVALYSLGDVDGAYAALRESTRWPMPDGRPWFYLAVTALRMNRTDEALHDSEVALKISPTARDYHRLHGEILGLTGDRRGMRQELETELRIHPDNDAAKRSLSQLPRQ